MKTKNGIRQLKVMMQLYIPTDENIDIIVIGAVIDELSGTKPDGTAEQIAQKQYKRTGYTFPKSGGMKRLFSDPQIR